MASGFDALTLWTVTHNTSDYPGLYVARRHAVERGRYGPTADHFTADTLDEIRQRLIDEKGMGFMMIRDPSDDPVIVESWI